MFEAFRIPIGIGELLKRTAKEISADDCLGLAAQLAYYFFLAVFPTVLFLLALASFFPLTNFTDEVVRTLRPIAPPEVLAFFEDQLRRLANADSGGILTIGILGAVWSSSAAVIAIIGSLNRAYDIDEGRPWWKVRLTAIGLTIALALMVLISFTLIVAGPSLAQHLVSTFGLGAAFEWTWTILRWPVSFFLVSTAVGLIYYFAPDAEQDWVWITPGAVVGTLLWVLVSLGFKLYASNFADYNATYGTVGGIIVLLLWFYISGLAILVGAELNAEIEHASPYGKASGEKVPGQKKKIGVAAARAYRKRLEERRTGSQELPNESASNQTKRSAMTIHTDDRSLGEMFAELTREARTLIQQEIHLARTELAEKATTMRKSTVLIVGGGVIAWAGVLALVAMLVLALTETGLPAWASALLVGVLFAGGGYLLVRAGINALQPQTLAPRQTIDTLKENAQWLKSHAR